MHNIKAISKTKIRIRAMIHGQNDPSQAVPTNVYLAYESNSL